jgi:hypothetical protein
MITKEHLAASMLRECDIAKHLFTKVPEGGFDYRPSPDQRSTLELLRYLAICGIGGIRAMEANDLAVLNEYKDQVADMEAAAFPETMDHQKVQIREYFAGVDDRTLETIEAKLPGAGAMPLDVAIMNGPLKWLTAYRMQLFLYAKASGAPGLGTANAWAGIDWRG